VPRRTDRAGGESQHSARTLERAIAALESSLEPFFAERHYREFFERVHGVRQSFRTAQLSPGARDELWQRLNRLADAAKARQAREFAARDVDNLGRWRDQLARAEAYVGALDQEIAELGARTGPPAELSRWQRRIAEKRSRRTSVQATVADLQRKIAETTARRGFG